MRSRIELLSGERYQSGICKVRDWWRRKVSLGKRGDKVWVVNKVTVSRGLDNWVVKRRILRI